jgi:hypothetical protein
MYSKKRCHSNSNVITEIKMKFKCRAGLHASQTFFMQLHPPVGHRVFNAGLTPLMILSTDLYPTFPTYFCTCTMSPDVGSGHLTLASPRSLISTSSPWVLKAISAVSFSDTLQ